MAASKIMSTIILWFLHELFSYEKSMESFKGHRSVSRIARKHVPKGIVEELLIIL